MATTELLKTENGYNFWRVRINIVDSNLGDGFEDVWNITPIDGGAPDGGYRSKEYIERMKGQKFDN